MIQKSIFVACFASVAVLALSPAPANANPLFTFGFTELDGDYVSATKRFTAVASNMIGNGTSGDVTRVLAPSGTAFFDDGFVGGSSADFQLELTLSNITSTTADAVGSFTITDADGDTLTGNISGSWFKTGPFATFVGSLGGVAFSDPNDTFDGPDGGSFSMDFNNSPFPGMMTQIALPGGWFDVGDFQDADTLVDAQIIPAPAAVLLGVLGLGLVRPLRRRFS